MIQYNIPVYNIYFGTIGKTLGVKYQYSKKFRTKEQALEEARRGAEAFYYKNEGKYNIPSYIQISKESDITGISIEDLYKEHIDDFMRWYAIPADEDSIPRRKLKW